MNSDSNDRRHRLRRRIRAIVTLSVTGVATAAIGFGGLAAWTAVTENDGSSFATGTVHHSNGATANVSVVNATGSAVPIVNCTDATSPGACGLIINVTAAKPGAVATGTVKITNTGSLDSTFALSQVGAPVVGGAGVTLCGDLTLQVQDNESPVGTPVTTQALTAVTGSYALKTSNTSPIHSNSATWSTTDTGTFTFTFSLPGSVNTDQGSTCTAKFLFTQTNS